MPMPIEAPKIQIPRKGQVETVVPQDEAEFIRLRSELELLHQCGYGAADEFTEALAAKTQDLWELNSILRDARDPVVIASLAQIDSEFPDIRRRLELDTITNEAAKIRQEMAEQVRTSGTADAADAADRYATALPASGYGLGLETFPDMGAEMSDPDMTEQSIENVLENVEANVQALQEIVEHSETGSPPDAKTAPNTPDVSDTTDSPVEAVTAENAEEPVTADMFAEASAEPIAEVADPADTAADTPADTTEIADPTAAAIEDVTAENAEEPVTTGTPAEASAEPTAEVAGPADTAADTPADTTETANPTVAAIEDVTVENMEESVTADMLAEVSAELTAETASPAEVIAGATRDAMETGGLMASALQNPAAAGSEEFNPPELANRIQAGLQQVANFLVTEINQLLPQAAAARDRLLRYQAEAAGACEEITQLRAEVAALRADAVDAVDLAQQARIEAQTCRDEAEVSSKRTACYAEEAQIAANRARSESQAAQTYAQRIRKPILRDQESKMENGK
ncbi:MAG: hypothetical protein KAV82_04140 [Phycisphaerae bacterium]|nr:hypothetical protein [Phycisphaerae bacterium]